MANLGSPVKTTEAPVKAPKPTMGTVSQPKPPKASAIDKAVTVNPVQAPTGMHSSAKFARPLAKPGVIPTGLTAKVPAAAPGMENVSIPDPLADPTYKAQKADLAKQLADYQASNRLQNQQYDGSYNTGLNKLGWNPAAGQWDSNNVAGSYGQAYQDNANDYASRGMYRSGLLGKSVGDLNTSFNQQKTDLDTGRKNFDDTQNQALSQYTSQNQATDQNDLRDAISRIAAQYGVNLNQVVQGGNTVQIPKVGN